MQIAFVLGTRPELLKLTSILKCFEKHFPGLALIADTRQQQLLKDGLFSEYELKNIDYIALKAHPSSLSAGLAGQLSQLGALLTPQRHLGVVVQGDTISALAGALAGFYANLPVAHVEAGLRSNNLQEPFPEELNRRMITCTAGLHLAPNDEAKDALLSEGVSNADIVTIGNPLLDLCQPMPKLLEPVDVILTMHRRENRPLGILRVCQALSCLAEQHPSLQFAVINHSHPDVHRVFTSGLANHSNIIRLASLTHRQFLSLIRYARLIMTDSGGVQEESAMFGKPTLILRNVADRPDGLSEGTAHIIGTQTETVIAAANNLLHSPIAKETNTIPKTVGGFRSAHLALAALIKFFNLNAQTTQWKN